MTTELEYKKEEKSVLGTVANIKYYHQTAAWDSPLSFGVQAFIEYNGLILNDRHQADLIRVTKVTGIDDAEVRDSREPRPGQSGEFAYDSFYGGRNIVLNGFIEAGSLSAKENLYRNLKAAFAPLSESYIKFRWFDVYDPFDDPNTILEYKSNAKVGSGNGNYTALKGKLSNLKIENGLLSWKKPEEIYFLRTSDKRIYCDVQMTLGCMVGEIDSSSIGFVLCAKDSENYLICMYSDNILSISSVLNNEESEIASGSLPLSIRPIVGQKFWLRGRKEGNSVACEFWNIEPTENALPSFSISANLFGANEERFGDEILSNVGIASNQTNTFWSFDSLKIESLYPGDVQANAKKINFSCPDEQNSLTKFKRPFQITLKASDFRFLSSTQIIKSIFPTNNLEGNALGRIYTRKYPLSYRVFTSSSFPLSSNLLSVNNRGNTYIEPTLFLYGPGENILLENLTNGQILEWLGSIKKEEYIVFNCSEETIENSSGSNFSEFFVPTSEWIRFEPMWNDIYISGSGFEEGITKLVAKYRHGYM